MSTVPRPVTFRSGLVISRSCVSATPLAMLKVPPNELNCVLAPGPCSSLGIWPAPTPWISSVRLMPSIEPSVMSMLPLPASECLISSPLPPVPLNCKAMLVRPASRLNPAAPTSSGCTDTLSSWKLPLKVGTGFEASTVTLPLPCPS